MIEPEPENEIMRRGRWFEAAIIAALVEQEPSWVSEGKITKAQAEREIRAMQAILDDCERKGDLFGGAL